MGFVGEKRLDSEETDRTSSLLPHFQLSASIVTCSDIQDPLLVVALIWEPVDFELLVSLVEPDLIAILVLVGEAEEVSAFAEAAVRKYDQRIDTWCEPVFWLVAQPQSRLYFFYEVPSLGYLLYKVPMAMVLV